MADLEDVPQEHGRAILECTGEPDDCCGRRFVTSLAEDGGLQYDGVRNHGVRHHGEGDRWNYEIVRREPATPESDDA